MDPNDPFLSALATNKEHDFLSDYDRFEFDAMITSTRDQRENPVSSNVGASLHRPKQSRRPPPRLVNKNKKK